MSLQLISVSLQAYKVEDLRRIVALQRKEIMAKNDQLQGVKDLTDICHDLEEKRDSWEAKAVNYENALRRAEARIAYLNKKLGIGPQTAFNIDVVSPGISRKDFEALTRENIRLKEALDHIVHAELGGQDVVLKNRELYELVTTLREDLAQRDHHINELEKILAGKEDDLATRVNTLTKLLLKHERSLTAKQVFSENLLKENKKLKDFLEKREVVDVVNRQTLDVSEDLADGHVRNNAQMNKDRTVPSRSDVPNEEKEMLKAMIEAKEKKILEYSSKNEEIKEEIEKLNKKIEDLTSEVEKANDVVKKAQAELSETTSKCNDFQKKCAGFFKQVVSLNDKQLQSENEISTLKRANDNLRADVEEKKAMFTMMTDSLKNYEEDFQREHEDKANFEKKLRTAQQESERLKRENQSHMATIRHFETEIERMNKLLNDERSRKNTGGLQSPFGHALGTSASRSIFQDRNPPVGLVVADGPGINESDSSGQRNQYSTGNKKSEPPKSSTPTLIECPYCSRSYPYHLIEGHVQDCMEDSLYMDD